MTKPTRLTLTAIAERITEHLRRIESDPELNPLSEKYRTRMFYHARSWSTGRRIGIRYVSYQCEWKLTKADALEYLAWLDAGNTGSHHQMERQR